MAVPSPGHGRQFGAVPWPPEVLTVAHAATFAKERLLFRYLGWPRKASGLSDHWLFSGATGPKKRAKRGPDPGARESARF